MFAVIKTGGKQYKVAENDVISVATLAGEPGDVVAFDHVLMLTSDKETQVGGPTLSGVSVAGEIVEHGRGPKVIAFKKRRRKNSRRKRGHRQDLTIVRITDILTGGAKPKAKAKSEGGKAEGTKAEGGKAEAKSAAKPAAAAADESRDSSNLSLISGIGPTIEKKLRAAGITRWEEIASWSEADIAKWDEELKLRGRATREEWVEQAKELLAGKPPRAKIDQAEEASGEDL